MDFVLVGIAHGLGYATLTIYTTKIRKRKYQESEHGKKHRKLW